MKKALLIAQVASLGRDIEVSKVNLVDYGFQVDTYYDDDDDDACSAISRSEYANGEDPALCGILENIGLNEFNSSTLRRNRVIELLGEWEEPGEQRKTVSVMLFGHSSFELFLIFRHLPLYIHRSPPPLPTWFSSDKHSPVCTPPFHSVLLLVLVQHARGVLLVPKHYTIVCLSVLQERQSFHFTLLPCLLSREVATLTRRKYAILSGCSDLTVKETSAC
jgi:hypothetical protein